MTSQPPTTASLSLLSAGAIKTVIAAIAEAYGERTGVSTHIEFATAPAIEKRDLAGEGCDLVAAPRALIRRLGESGRVRLATTVPLSRVGIGMVGREGYAAPDISSEQAFRDAVRRAEGIVVNAASTGLYVEALLARLGLTEELAERMIRVATGRDVMETIARSPEGVIAFGAITEIEVHRELGVHVAAELPPTLQNYTTYDLAALAGAPGEVAATAFVAFAASDAADRCFAACHAERAA